MIYKAPNDHRQYRSLTLPNGLRVLLISDPETEQAGAAMGVNAGSGHEPTDFPGLAHLLEHMLFLGTEKYPAPDDFPTYIQGHGGRYNATTVFAQTRYFFEIPPAHLAGALDRFAQFFIAPRLAVRAIAQERDVIDAEYQARLQDEEQRLLGVIKQVLNPAHPASRFFAGNRDTLGGPPEVLQQALRSFRQCYYTAANMHLVILGDAPLDTLEQQVGDYFNALPLQQEPDKAPPTPLFQSDTLPLRLALQPAHECHELRLCFPVPALRPEDYQQPWDYLGQLLAFRGGGSLYGQLKDKGWLTDLECSILLDTWPQALLQIRLKLTPDGIRQQKAIMSAVFTYVQQITTDGIVSWRHEERQTLAQQRFEQGKTTSTIEFVKTLAHNLSRYPMTEALRGPYRLDAFQAQVISHCLEHLTPDNLLALTISPSIQTDRTSPWFPAPYRLAPISAGHKEQTESEFELPPPNPFITEPPRFIKAMAASDTPRLLRYTEQCRIWHQPLAPEPSSQPHVYLNLISAGAERTLTATVLTELLIAWLEQELAAALQQARATGLQLALSRHHQGITLKASGFPAQLETLLQQLLQSLTRNRITPARVRQTKQTLQTRWHQQQHDYAFRRLLQLPAARLGYGFSEEERLAALATVQPAQLKTFRDELLRNLGIDGLIAGHLNDSQALRIVSVVETNLLTGHMPPVTRQQPAIMPLQTGQTYHHRLMATHSETAVALYLPASNSSPLEEARYRLLAPLLHDPFFQQLRTEQQLGYVVMARYLPLHNRPGLILLVQSPSVSVEELKDEIRRFLMAYKESLLALESNSFAHYRDGLRQSLQMQQRQPDQRIEQHWFSLTTGDTTCQRPLQLRQALSELTLEDMQRFYQTLLQQTPWVWLHT